jgi:ribosomal protein S18 acetylase RimI-like enzyme
LPLLWFLLAWWAIESNSVASLTIRILCVDESCTMSISDLELRPYSPIDWDQLCAIHDAARVQELELSGLSAAYLTLAQTAENEGLFDGELFVAEDHVGVCGFAAIADGELTWLYVAPSRYKQGIGRRLLRHAIKAAKGDISTEVLVGNEPALALYLSEGFKIVRRVDGKLAGNESFAASGYELKFKADEAS